MLLKQLLKDDLIKYTDTVFKFNELFNTANGFYIRGDCKDTKTDPFMRSFPSLLDIGIMSGCKSCRLCNVDCYQGGKDYNPLNDMTFENYKKIIDEGCKKGLQQVALGGAGNPNDHQYFKEILEYTRSKNVVPNYTTSGVGLTDEMAEVTKTYCGAAAVSWYYQQFTVDAIKKFLKYNMKTSIHFVLSKRSICDAINLLKTNKLIYNNYEEFDLTEHGINAVIFLLYKPVGLGKRENILTLKEQPLIEEFFKLFDDTRSYKVGFDSCSVPAILNYAKNISKASIDTCEGGRFSAYINSQMVMTPCSFDQYLLYGVQLNDSVSIEDAWNSDKFSRFRQLLQLSCTGCSDQHNCYGGCPLMKSVVLCNRQEQNFFDVLKDY